MEELENAAKLLRTALDHYLGVCLKIHSLVANKDTPHNIREKYLYQIDTEMDHFPSYKQKLGQAGATVCRVRNRLSRLTPVTSLPPEILTRIFHFVASPCDMLRFSDDEYSHLEIPGTPNEVSDADDSTEWPRSKSLQLKNFPTHLDRITHVCASWRRTAVGTPSLWTHIDFIPNPSLYRKLLGRAETYAARAVQLPLELHIADDNPLTYDKNHLSKFLSSILHRVKSLDMVMTHFWRNFHGLVFNELFPHLAPGSTALTKLTVRYTPTDGWNHDFIDWFRDANEGLFRLTTIHFRGILPLCRSMVYHNLVDLRLISPRYTDWINISELQSILAASPGLHIFHFALGIIEQGGEPTIPVRLDDLQVLVISTNGEGDPLLPQLGPILRLLEPGSKPLRVSISHNFSTWSIETNDYEFDTFGQDELVKFFQRSNVVKFCVKDKCPPLNQLLCHTSNFEDLVLDSCVPSWRTIAPFERDDSLPFCSNSLTLHNCQPTDEQLGLLLKYYPTNLLVASNCDWSSVALGYNGQHPIQSLLAEYLNTRLVMKEGQLSHPTADWDLID